MTHNYQTALAEAERTGSAIKAEVVDGREVYTVIGGNPRLREAIELAADRWLADGQAYIGDRETVYLWHRQTDGFRADHDVVITASARRIGRRLAEERIFAGAEVCSISGRMVGR